MLTMCNTHGDFSVVVQWLRLCAPMQAAWVPSNQELDPAARLAATKINIKINKFSQKLIYCEGQMGYALVTSVLQWGRFTHALFLLELVLSPLGSVFAIHLGMSSEAKVVGGGEWFGAEGLLGFLLVSVFSCVLSLDGR